MAVIQDLVLTFCPTMHSVQQKKPKLLMPVFINTTHHSLSSRSGSTIAFSSFTVQIITFYVCIITKNLQ